MRTFCGAPVGPPRHCRMLSCRDIPHSAPQHEVTLQSLIRVHDAVIKATNERKFMVEKDAPSSVALVYPRSITANTFSSTRLPSGGYRTSPLYSCNPISTAAVTSASSPRAFEDKLCGHPQDQSVAVNARSGDRKSHLAYKEPAVIPFFLIQSAARNSGVCRVSSK